ncbi:MAG TPA: hypothetical protein VIX35_02880 [Vicinamibacterales bacterium]
MTERALKEAAVPTALGPRVRADVKLLPRRLLSLRQAASYLGLSYAQTRELVIRGYLPHIRLPCPRAGDGRAMRKFLIDQRDLDGFIDRHKRAGAP